MEFLNDKNLLLLEDSDEFIENAVSLFNMFVKKTFVAKNIKEAFKILDEEKIDLIISDINLKNENGLDFVEIFRNKNNEIPILVLSGYKDEDLLFRAMTLNLSGYLIKPINFKALLDAFEKCESKIRFNNQTIIELKDGFKYDKNLKRVIKDNEIFELNKKEILFFEMLCENKKKVVTKDMFIKFVYEDEFMSDSALNNFILRIRKRFGKNFLHTIPDIGYKMIV
ncbi:response regulator transcription factor [Aliarcobacter butzleri]|uniref:response regulator transcription factor n=1 Tax=Aliarcobacter butzleri TaxID=28197 RepID=UPI003B227ED8